MSKSLTQQQFDVLHWIQDGCPEGVYGPGYEHRIVARGLARRGFVSVTGRGPTWTATIRPAGQEVLAGPPPETEPAPERTEADLLYERVVAAGGRLILGDDSSGREVGELVEEHLKSPHRPFGKRLVKTGGFYDPVVVSIEENYEELVEARPVPVPERVAKYHPAVKRFKQDKDIQRVTQDHIQRAALILQAIANEAGHRGIEIVSHEKAAQAQSSGRGRIWGAHLIFTVEDHQYLITVREIAGAGAKKVQYDYRSYHFQAKQPAWLRQRGWEFISTGRLEIIVDGRYTKYDGDRYRDGKRAKLEDKLPEIFRKLEIYRLESHAAQRRHELVEEEKQRRLEHAREKAKERYYRQQHWQHFIDVSAQAREFAQHRDFLMQARTAVETYDGEDKDAIIEYLEWIGSRIEARDPATNPEQLLPKVTEPSQSDLEQYLPSRYQRSWAWR